MRSGLRSFCCAFQFWVVDLVDYMGYMGDMCVCRFVPSMLVFGKLGIKRKYDSK
jgi:hypothetical protein